jgi:hypothetical protein
MQWEQRKENERECEQGKHTDFLFHFLGTLPRQSRRAGPPRVESPFPRAISGDRAATAAILASFIVCGDNGHFGGVPLDGSLIVASAKFLASFARIENSESSVI